MLLLPLVLALPVSTASPLAPPSLRTDDGAGAERAHASDRKKGGETAGTLVVLNKSDNTAWFLDAATGEKRFEVETGVGPHEVAIGAGGEVAVVADYGDGTTPGKTLTVIDVARRAVDRKIDLGEYTRPHGILFLGPSRLLVTSETRQALVEVDLASGDVLRAIPTGQRASHMVAASPDGKRAFVANIADGSLSAIDLEAGERIGIIETGAGCEGIAVSPDGTEVWTSNRSADTVSVLDAQTLALLDEIPCPGFPIRVQLTPDGRRALVSCPNAGVLAVYDAPARELVERVPMSLAPAEGSEEHLFGDQFGQSPVPIGIQVRPDGRVAYVANTNANRIAVVDLASLRVFGALETGRQPDGLGWLPASR